VTPRILVVDDEDELRVSLSKVLQRSGYAVEGCGSMAKALEWLTEGAFDLLLTDFKLPDGDGLELMRQARVIAPDLEVVLITAFGNIPLAVDAIKQGAYDFLTKPFKRADLERVVARALERQALAAENRRLRVELADRSVQPGVRIIGQSPAIRQILQMAEQVAPSSATVLITGESGTGKELVAEAIHRLSPRRAQALVKVNCAALPETLLEAELFGYERGAFTGAVGRRDGRFSLAHKGTLFLDEVGTTSLAVQVKLLRVLQDGTFEPLGSTRTLRADCRIIAATNVDLEQEVKAGRFREDLYYRLNVIVIGVPPLRERREDIPLLANHFLRLHAARNGKSADTFSPSCLTRLTAYHWPGNVRELEHAVERAVVLSPGRTVDCEHLPAAVSGLMRGRTAPGADEGSTIQIPLGTPLEEVERRLIEETLKTTGGNKQRAAELLGIAARTIYRKLPPGRQEGRPEEGAK
jgi:two-component system response regulator HydG